MWRHGVDAAVVVPDHATGPSLSHLFVQDFHDREKETLVFLSGNPLTNHQRALAKLPTNLGGFGLVSAPTEIGLDVVSLADLGFLSSPRRCGPDIQQLVGPLQRHILHEREGPASSI